jgi:Ca2+-transporting ATPase
MEVLAMCNSILADDGPAPLTVQMRTRIQKQNASMARRQLRVLGFAYAERPQDRALPAESENLIWLGLIGLADPIRPDVENIIAAFHQAGIRTAMITGDQRATALAIGEHLGLSNERTLQVLDSTSLDDADSNALKQLVAKADVFARVSPGRKLQIVQALQSLGEVVAMTGDGVNDGPALRAADIGIAMGMQGTNLARSAADVVLKDDRLDTVLDAIRQGRAITENIEKSLRFLISSNLSEILAVLGAVSLTGTAPLTPIQLLWINLLSDVLPAVALAAEPPEHDVMARPPRDASKPLIGKSELIAYGRQGTWLAGGALGAYLYGLTRYGAGAKSSGLAFNALMLGQLLHALSCRSSNQSHAMFRPRTKQRNLLDQAVFGSIALQVGANLLPLLRRLLGLGQSMNIADVAVIMAGAGLPYLANQAAKQQTFRPFPPNEPPAGIGTAF